MLQELKSTFGTRYSWTTASLWHWWPMEGSRDLPGPRHLTSLDTWKQQLGADTTRHPIGHQWAALGTIGYWTLRGTMNYVSLFDTVHQAPPGGSKQQASLGTRDHQQHWMTRHQAPLGTGHPSKPNRPVPVLLCHRRSVCHVNTLDLGQQPSPWSIEK